MTPAIRLGRVRTSPRRRILSHTVRCRFTRAYTCRREPKTRVNDRVCAVTCVSPDYRPERTDDRRTVDPVATKSRERASYRQPQTGRDATSRSAALGPRHDETAWIVCFINLLWKKLRRRVTAANAGRVIRSGAHGVLCVGRVRRAPILCTRPPSYVLFKYADGTIVGLIRCDDTRRVNCVHTAPTIILSRFPEQYVRDSYPRGKYDNWKTHLCEYCCCCCE